MNRSKDLLRSILTSALILILCSCAGPQVGMPDRTPLSVEGYSYPYQILHRLKGAASLPWFHDTKGCPVDQSKATEVIDNALSKWNLRGTVQFEPASSAEEAVVQILWQQRDTRGLARFGNSESILAQVVKSPELDVVKIVLNSSLNWDLGEPSNRLPEPTGAGASQQPRFPDLPQPNLHSVIVHEGGHVLGLGHVDLEDSVMQPLQGHTLSDPSEGDFAGIRSLYGDDSPATAGDLQILCSPPSGEEYLAAPIIRSIAPVDRVRVYVVDLDGDDREELLLLQSAQSWQPGTGLLIIDFDERSLLKKTFGPLPAAIDGSSLICYGRTPSGDGVIAFPTIDDKYSGMILKGGRLPVSPWTVGTPWESLKGGGGDREGDGILDQPITGLEPLGTCDLDGDGHKEQLKQGADQSKRASTN